MVLYNGVFYSGGRDAFLLPEELRPNTQRREMINERLVEKTTQAILSSDDPESIMEYIRQITNEAIDAMQAVQDQLDANLAAHADHFVNRLRAAQERINAGERDDHGMA